MPPIKEKIVNIAPGTVVFREGDVPDYAYVLLSGEVEISTERDGERVVLTKIPSNEMFGELALLEDTPRSATATTIGGCEVMAINKARFLKKLEALDPFTRYWVVYLAERIKDLSKRAGRSQPDGASAE